MTAHNDPPTTPGGADDELLPCGRLLSEVWQTWEDQADDEHARTCPYCRQAVADLDQLETVVRDLREEPDQDLGRLDASSLTRRVMDVVRLELRPGRPLPLGEPDEDLWIMEAVAARALRTAAETVPGVRAGSCRLKPSPRDDEEADGVEIHLDVHAPLDAALQALADDVRARVQEAAQQRIGMETAAVHIHVTDVTEPPADAEDGTYEGQEGRTR
ncbi:Asp23/Gls24 family envelope stress response protein [Streptomyces sp. NPDC102360]|uniref:Asp23/Gls24 family envelope stress response protein n=1 Tax=Streptomyces sp. NPDC102360 TaxID=3366160 RepID=UPI0037F71F40